VTIPTGFIAALCMWYGSSRLDNDNAVLRKFESDRTN
jgi:hypothetical protein